MVVTEADVLAILDWDPASADRPEFAFMPARVLLQDFTGVPCVVDLAALRTAVARNGGKPNYVRREGRIPAVVYGHRRESQPSITNQKTQTPVMKVRASPAFVK